MAEPLTDRAVDEHRDKLGHPRLGVARVLLADEAAHLEVVHLTGEVVDESVGNVRHLLFHGQRNSGHDPSTPLATTEATPLSHPRNRPWQAQKL